MDILAFMGLDVETVEIAEKICKLDAIAFQTLMCFMFDEHYNQHRDGKKSPEIAQECADMVKEVNSELGDYENLPSDYEDKKAIHVIDDDVIAEVKAWSNEV